MKRKTITLVVYMLVCMSLVSVGFAAWVITGGTETTAQAGIEASTVTDKSLNISNGKWYQNIDDDADLEEVTGNAEIVFGKPAGVTPDDSTAGYDWLRWDSAGVPDEMLEATYKFTLTVGDGTGETLASAFSKTGSDISFAIDADHSDELEAVYETKKYINEPKLTYYIGATAYETKDALFTALAASDAKELEISVKVTFAWGTDFNGSNPFNFYNTTVNPSQDQKTAAKNALNALFALNGASYTLTIKLAGNK